MTEDGDLAGPIQVCVTISPEQVEEFGRAQYIVYGDNPSGREQWAEGVARRDHGDWFASQGLDYDYHHYGASIMSNFEEGPVKVSYYFNEDQLGLSMQFTLLFAGE